MLGREGCHYGQIRLALKLADQRWLCRLGSP
jgi:hypothetical protein